MIADTVKTKINVIIRIHEIKAMGLLNKFRSGLVSMKGNAARRPINAPGRAMAPTNCPNSPPKVLEEVYGKKDKKFFDSKGTNIWTNKANVPYVAFSGKCPHLGCGYKWRRTKNYPEGVFLCPCHLSLYDESGKVVDGPAPRALDVLPTEVLSSGEIKIIDVEYKAGVKRQIRLL